MIQLSDLIHQIVNQKWDFYIEGWFHQTDICFLPNGSIEGHGAEGFHTWQVEENRLNVYDELGVHTLSLVYFPEAQLLKNTAQLRKHNNNVFLARAFSDDERQKMFSSELGAQIAHRIAAYRSPKGEVWGYLFFGIDGKIHHYDHNNERKWQIKHNQLCLMQDNGTETARSETILYHNHAPESIKSIHLNFKADNYEAKHYLDFFAPPQHVPQFFHANICLSNRSDVLFVSFNSAAGQYDGYSVPRYEFHNIPYALGVDYIRIAQSPPTRWYLDNYKQIESLIQIKPYKKVVLAGMSIGGFAALWFGEKLARYHPHIVYHSVVIQPQTSLNPEFLHDLRYRFSKVHDKRPKVPNNGLIEQLQRHYPNLSLDIAEWLPESVSNLKHHIFYDSGNEAERCCSERMQSERSILYGFDFNGTHASACGKIWETGKVQKLLYQLLETL